jgi:hypothetical protein
MKLNIIILGLYAILGAVLAACGIAVIDKPFEFLGIMVIVWLIHITAYMRGVEAKQSRR